MVGVLQFEVKWKLSVGSDAKFMRKFMETKGRNIKRKVDDLQTFDNITYFRYATFLHMCGSNCHLEPRQHLVNLRMMQGAFYDEETVRDMERPLKDCIATLMTRLKDENPEEFYYYEHLVGQMIKKIKVQRTSANSTKPLSVPLASENMRSRKRVVAGGVISDTAAGPPDG